jgi:hypothetical protein
MMQPEQRKPVFAMEQNENRKFKYIHFGAIRGFIQHAGNIPANTTVLFLLKHPYCELLDRMIDTSKKQGNGHCCCFQKQ